MPRPLNPRQERFCEEYVVDLSATAAASRAGYAPASAGQLMLNPRVLARIDELKAARSARVRLTADDVLSEYAKVAFSDIRGVLTVSTDGVRIHPSDTWTDSQAATVSEVHEDKDGRIKLKMHSKLHALDMIGKHLGMFIDRKLVNIKPIEDMSETELAMLVGEEAE